MSQFASDSTVDELEVAAAMLTGLDRCDYCGAQAYVKATLATGELLFCAHHAAEFKEKVQPIALDWHDESSRLLAPVSD
ncbi:hypothetical protein [Pseudolysinimonas sp.]|uniref:DUF7455 domain-containing protein n=1 Tax=Pseudolysinimonas sp. TaxID=2680009 RepID=UPI00286BB818|nr:hypothetical protein [Pseudolysinimonas sp.]